MQKRSQASFEKLSIESVYKLYIYIYIYIYMYAPLPGIEPFGEGINGCHPRYAKALLINLISGSAKM